MIIFAISGSIRNKSSNTSVLQTLKSLTPAGVEFVTYEGLGSLPHFNPDLDNDDLLPDEVRELRGMVARSKAILISTPEYAHGVPGVLKNALDWLVSTVTLENKPAGIILGSSSDASFARDSLVEILKTMNATVNPERVLSIQGLREKLDDPKLWQQLRDFIESLALDTQLKS